MVIFTMIMSVISSVFQAIFTGIVLIFKGIGLMLWYILKYLGLALWYGVIKIPYYIYLLFRKMFKRREGGGYE